MVTKPDLHRGLRFKLRLCNLNPHFFTWIFNMVSKPSLTKGLRFKSRLSNSNPCLFRNTTYRLIE